MAFSNVYYDEDVKAKDTPAAAKYSRYRGVKRIIPNTDSQVNINVERAPSIGSTGPTVLKMGRYRRHRGIPKTDSPLIAPIPLQPKEHVDISLESSRNEEVNHAQDPSVLVNEEKDLDIDEVLSSTPVGHNIIDEFDVKDDMGSGFTNSPLTSIADRLAKQKAEDLQRLQVQLDDAPSAVPLQAPYRGPKKDDKTAGIFSRRKAVKSIPQCTQNLASGTSTATTTSLESEHCRKIEQGVDAITSQIDAPMSAVNSGERRVLVRFKQSSINLPVIPETTAADLIHAAGRALGREMTTESIQLLESYTQLGLERRIRNYEHIRDVMNSWDRDTQNALILEEPSGKHNIELEVESVPVEAPPGTSVFVNYSQKNGKWSKRYVTLLSSGQMFIAKHPGAKSTDKTYQNICHLSDFDIYTAMSLRAQRNHNSREKNFYAIKSQQKTTMFLSSQNFVHYFSTNDSAVGQKLYVAVQRWRSWFQVNRKGEGNTKVCPIKVNQLGLGRIDTHSAHSEKLLTNAICHNMGSLVSPGKINQSKSEETNESARFVHEVENNSQLQTPSHRNISPKPPPALNSPDEENREFLSSSLLGRSYSERKRELIDEIVHRQRSATSPTKGMNYDPQSPRGLLDFSVSLEPPQWKRQGKGHGIRPAEGVKLVDIACTNGILSSRTVETPRPNTLLGRKDSKFSQRSVQSKISVGDGPFVEGGLIASLVNASESANKGLVSQNRSASRTLPNRSR